MSGVGSTRSYSWNLRFRSRQYRPSVARLRVAQPCDREPGPVRTVLGPPRRAAFEDGDGAVGDVHLETDLVSSVFRNAAVGPPPDLIERILWDHDGSSRSGRRILTLRGSTTTTQLRSSSSGWVLINRWMRDRMLSGSCAAGRRTRIPAWLPGG
jgi:hypothetical protein